MFFHTKTSAVMRVGGRIVFLSSVLLRKSIFRKIDTFRIQKFHIECWVCPAQNMANCFTRFWPPSGSPIWKDRFLLGSFVGGGLGHVPHLLHGKSGIAGNALHPIFGRQLALAAGTNHITHKPQKLIGKYWVNAGRFGSIWILTDTAVIYANRNGFM